MPSQSDLSAVLPVSVHVLTYNSGTTLARALQSVGPVAEIIIMDGGSADDTLAIARQFRATILDQQEGKHGPIADFSVVRNRALVASTQPWILALDSDEELTAALREEISRIARASQTPAAYWMSRKYVSPQGSIIEQASMYPDERLRFFHRAAVTRWLDPLYGRVQLVPGVSARRLQSSCLTALPSREEFRRKSERYARLQGQSGSERTWARWLSRRLLPFLHSRSVATLRIIGIWCVPHGNKRLPLSYEWLAYWSAWRVLMETRPHRHLTKE